MSKITNNFIVNEENAALSSLLIEMAENTVEAAIPEGFTLIEGEEGKLDVPSAFLETLKHPDIEDSNPMFITVEMRSGASRFLTLDSVLKGKTEIAHRIWPGDIIWQFAEQIRTRKLPGYSGHDGIYNMHEVPADIPFIWVAAAKAVNKDGRPVSLVRGYVRKGSPMRQYIRLEQVDSFSVFSLADSEIVDGEEFGYKDQKVVKVTKAALLSFDAVRKGTEGILGTKVVVKENANVFEVEVAKAISTLTPEQLKELNPQLFAQLAKTENSADLDDVVKKLQNTIREKIDLQEGAAIADKLTEILGCEKAQVVTIVNNIITAQKTAVEGAIKSALSDFDNRPVLQGQIRKALNAKKNQFGSATEVGECVEETLALIQEMSGIKIKKSKIGASVGAGNGRRRSINDSFISDEIAELAEVEVGATEFGSFEDDDESDEDEE